MARQVVEMILTRRTALLGLGSLLAAPAVVRASSLMPLRGVAVPFIYGDGVRCDADGLEAAFNGQLFANGPLGSGSVSLEVETVGGPVDVAVISKGDGFVWTKRKHYFAPELNPRYFAVQRAAMANRSGNDEAGPGD